MIKVKSAINPNHGEMANNVPPEQATPFPPDFTFAFSKSNLEANNLIKY
jgi:hypothetical protein